MGNTVRAEPSRTANPPVITRVAATNADAAGLAANPGRSGLRVHNDSAAGTYLLEASSGAASATNYTIFLGPGVIWEAAGSIWTGAIRRFSTAATGSVHFVEIV